MFEAVHTYYQHMDIVIAAAAVSDYRPKVVAAQKMKKEDAAITIELEPTQDILASMGALKKHQKLIGFALETTNELEHARGNWSEKSRFYCA